MAVPLKLRKPVVTNLIEILLGNPEFFQQLQLLKGPQGGNLRRTDFIENDLKHK